MRNLFCAHADLSCLPVDGSDGIAGTDVIDRKKHRQTEHTPGIRVDIDGFCLKGFLYDGRIIV